MINIGKKRKYENPEAAIKMTINMVFGLILAGFVVLNSMYFKMNDYLFLVIFILLIVVMTLINKFLKKRYLW